MGNWRIRTLEFSGLFRYAKQSVLRFDGSDALFTVVGVNLDAEGADSNGAGKSSIFDVIAWTLFGKTARSEAFEDVLRRGSQLASATLVMDDGVDAIQIKRERSLDGKTNDISVIVNGEDKTRRLNTLTQKFINRFFALDERKGFSDFLSQVYFSTTSSKGFLSSQVDPIDRQRVLERFLGLDVFDRAVELVKKDLKTVNRERLNELTFNLNFKRSQLDADGGEKFLTDKRMEVGDLVNRQTKILENAIRKFDDFYGVLIKWGETNGGLKDRVETRDHVEAELNRVGAAYIAMEKRSAAALEIRSNWVESGRKKYHSVMESSVDRELFDRLAACRRAHQTIDYNVKDLQREVSRLEAEIQKNNDMATVKRPKCPHCGSSLIVKGIEVTIFTATTLNETISHLTVERDDAVKRRDAEISKLAPAALAMADATEAINKRTSEKNAMESERKKFEDAERSLVELDDLAKHGEKTRVELDSAIKDVEAAQRRYDEAKQVLVSACRLGVEPLVMKTELFSDKMEANDALTDAVKELSAVETSLKRIQELKLDIVNIETEVTALAKKYDELSYWETAFVKMKADILLSFVPMFENEVNTNLSLFGVAERVSFCLQTETKRETFKNGFTIRVFDGANWADFDVYSGGEKGRVLVSVGFALRALSSIRSGASFGFLLCDELLDNLDETGMDFFFRVLKLVEGQKFIITHARPDDVQMNDAQVILVERKEGESTCRQVA